MRRSKREVVVRGARARAYVQYRDDADDIGSAASAYTDGAAARPQTLDDVSLFAIALKEHVRFSSAVREVFFNHLAKRTRCRLDALPSGVEFTPKGKAIREACVGVGGACEKRCAEALMLLFIEANGKEIDIDAREEVDPVTERYLDDDIGDAECVDDDGVPNVVTDTIAMEEDDDGLT